METRRRYSIQLDFSPIRKINFIGTVSCAIEKSISGYYYMFLVSVNFCKREISMRVSFLVLANDVDSADYYLRSMCVYMCARGRDIFNVYTDTLSHYNSPTRLRRATALVAVTISAAVKANFSSSSASSSSCSPCPLVSSSLANFYSFFGLHFCHISCLLFFPYISTALIQTPTYSRHECPFNTLKYAYIL